VQVIVTLRSLLEETMKEFIQSNSQTIQELRNSGMANNQAISTNGQAINEVKNATRVNTQAIANMKVQIGQIANYLGERDKGKLPSQLVPNPKVFMIGNYSNPMHG
jgi:hypothetical protein